MAKISRESFFKRTLLGGLVIILPVGIMLAGFSWLFRKVTDLIQPITNIFVKTLGFPEIASDILALLSVIALCFVAGWVVSTKIGGWFHGKFDGRMAQFTPGYRLVKSIVSQFFGDSSQSPFASGEVAMVKIFGADVTTEVTAIVTSRHADQRTVSVFVATGPNPTSGFIYHLPVSQVRVLPGVKVEDAFRTIIACGAGTGDMLESCKKNT